MTIEETLRMYAPDWKPAAEVREGDTIAVWGNWAQVVRTELRDGVHDLAVIYRSVKDGSEKSFTCRYDDLVAVRSKSGDGSRVSE